MRITQLEYFESVARNLSFTKASEECHVAQPAVSQQIRALEKELGFALLNRTTKGVTLTEAGRAYLSEITPILESLDRSARKARAISLGSAGSLAVGIANSGQTAVLGAIEQFSARYPEIHIELKRAHSLNQYQQLARAFRRVHHRIAVRCGPQRRFNGWQARIGPADSHEQRAPPGALFLETFHERPCWMAAHYRRLRKRRALKGNLPLPGPQRSDTHHPR